MRQKFNPGEKVWVVERDEAGNASDVSGFIFLAEVTDTAIVTPKVYGCDTLEEIMRYHIEETAKDYNTDLSVFPASDCYLYRCEAEEVLTKETGEED